MSEPRPRTPHELKTWPEFFTETRSGRKKFELRRNDRDFRVGDQLLLKEWDPAVFDAFLSDFLDSPSDMDIFEATQDAYTGRSVLVRVDYIMPVETVDKLMDLEIPYPAEHVIMSISHVN